MSVYIYAAEFLRIMENPFEEKKLLGLLFEMQMFGCYLFEEMIFEEAIIREKGSISIVNFNCPTNEEERNKIIENNDPPNDLLKTIIHKIYNYDKRNGNDLMKIICLSYAMTNTTLGTAISLKSFRDECKPYDLSFLE
jgi:predicted transcriptional regulator